MPNFRTTANTILRNFVLVLLIDVTVTKDANLPESAINRLHEPEAECTFSVHDKGPNGPEVTGTSLNQELYYKIKCKPETGYCLKVSNCSVTTDAPEQKPYPIIDESGCTTESSLFEHVQYEDNFTAGIYNPFPIRFRGQKSAVRFQCSTTLSPTGPNGACDRPTCTWNEYSREANIKSKN
ncbi:zona pellucida-like domain-containing protein [Ditylenchus destructor]|nr:zona pellucida-like domain-containing protein [Ditylenchus destructor]